MRSIDVAKLGVGMLMRRLDRSGSENFKIDRRVYHKQWWAMLDTREKMYQKGEEILIKDLTFGRSVDNEKNESF